MVHFQPVTTAKETANRYSSLYAENQCVFIESFHDITKQNDIELVKLVFCRTFKNGMLYEALRAKPAIHDCYSYFLLLFNDTCRENYLSRDFLP